MTARILVIDDLPSARSLFERFLGAAGYEVEAHASVETALESVRGRTPDVVITDLRMPGMDGLEGLRELLRMKPDLPVIMVTAYATVDTAVEAMRLGAFDYVRKPFEPDEVKMLVERALEKRRLERENSRLRVRVGEAAEAALVYTSRPMREVVSLVRRIAGADVTVLILGETGTGKDVIARMIHDLGPRAGGPFVSLNCCAIPEHLIESELFGSVKGAFSGAAADRPGFLRAASGGSLLLDEIGDLQQGVQPKLLRVLQSGEFYPVGSSKQARSDARILCATNQDLEALVGEGRFRADLYYRINVVTVRLPPLRERVEDITLLARSFMTRHAARFGTQERELGEDVLEFFCDYAWPGNVRQLENVVEYAVLVGGEGPIGLSELPSELLGGSEAPAGASGSHDYERAREAFELAYLKRLLEASGGNVASAARLAGVHRATLYKWLVRHGLQRPEAS